jgi:acyl-CoA dehydrogenase
MLDTTTREEHRMVQELVQKFVTRDLMPLEPLILAREANGGKYALTTEEEGPLRATCRELGLWALDAPEEYGGANLPTIALMGVEEEMARTVVPFTIPPDSPNLHMLVAVADAYQRERYLTPYAAGEMRSCIAISEPVAGGLVVPTPEYPVKPTRPLRSAGPSYASTLT